MFETIGYDRCRKRHHICFYVWEKSSCKRNCRKVEALHKGQLDIAALSRWTDVTRSSPFICAWQAQVHDTVTNDTNVSRDDIHWMFHVHRCAMYMSFFLRDLLGDQEK